MTDPDIIRRNVQKLIDAGAPESDIDEYVEEAQHASDADFSDVESGESSSRGPSGNIVQQAAEGASFGFGDEIAGAISKLTGGGYEAGKRDYEMRRKNYQKENPGKSLAAELGGAAASSLAAGPVSFARAGASVGRRLLTGAAEGAAAGGLYGAGTGEGARGRARGAAIGAGTGAVVGGVVAPAIGGTVKVLRNAAAPLIPKMAEPQANRLLSKALERDLVTPADITARAVPGKLQILPDVAGENVLGVARAAQATPSLAKESLSRNLRARGERQLGRVTGDVESALGMETQGAPRVARELVAAQQARAKPLYDAAHPQVITDPRVRTELVQLIEEVPVFRRAMSRGRQLAAVERAPASGNELTVRDIDYMKRGLDAEIEASRGSENAIARGEAHAYRQRLNELLELVDAQHPEYAQARQTYAGDARVQEALERGRDFLKTRADEVADDLAGMTESERELYRTGALDAIAQAMGTVGDESNVVTKIFGNANKREQLRALVGDEAFADLSKRLGAESRMHRTQSTVLGGSPTARIGAELADMGGMNLGEVALTGMDLARGNIVGALTRRGANALARRASGNVGNVADELARKLNIRVGTPEFDQLMRLLAQSARQSQRVGAGGSVARRAIAGAAGGAGR